MNPHLPFGHRTRTAGNLIFQELEDMERNAFYLLKKKKNQPKI